MIANSQNRPKDSAADQQFVNSKPGEPLTATEIGQATQWLTEVAKYSPNAVASVMELEEDDLEDRLNDAA